MSEQFTNDEESDYFVPGSNGHRTDTADNEQGELWSDEVKSVYVDYDALINAPDYSTLVKGTRSKVAKDYELKTKSVLKSAAMGRLRKGQLPDSAAIFRHGPAFSAALGDLAEVSEQTRKMVDLATAPENPYVMFLMVAIPFAMQLLRNHQPEIQEVQRTRREMRKYRKEHPEDFAKLVGEDKRKNVTVNLPFGRKMNVRVGFKFNPLKGIRFAFRAQTREPAELVTMVFSDQKLVAALKKQGIDIVQVPM